MGRRRTRGDGSVREITVWLETEETETEDTVAVFTVPISVYVHAIRRDMWAIEFENDVTLVTGQERAFCRAIGMTMMAAMIARNDELRQLILGGES
jgi:hypothetical protein